MDEFRLSFSSLRQCPIKVGCCALKRMLYLVFITVFKLEFFISWTLRFLDRRRRWWLFLFNLFGFLRYWCSTHFHRRCRVALAPNNSSDLLHFFEHILLELPHNLFFPQITCFGAFHSLDHVAIIIVVSRTLRLHLTWPNLLLTTLRFLDQWYVRLLLNQSFQWLWLDRYLWQS